MDYHEAANFLFDLRRYSPRAGVASTERLLGHLDDPHADLLPVQVAGSNGKGSTARMVERSLREAGLDVGLYTSPHLDDLRERILVNDRRMRKGSVCEFVDATEEYITERAGAGESPTFFETVTAMALWEFARADVDVAVLEVGIGGKHDATSVVDPVASAVTSVTLEHADVLGDTAAEIARDKAHVAPSDRPLVTGATGEALAAVHEVADERGGVLTVGAADAADAADDRDEAPDVTVDYHGREGVEGAVTLAGPDWSLDARLALLGAHQARNAGVAAALVRQTLHALEGGSAGNEMVDPDTALRSGLRNAHWPGRFEILSRDPLVVLDGAHNPGGCRSVAETLAEFDGEFDDLHLVVGAMADKDHAGMAAALPPGEVWTCRPDVDRAEASDALAAAFEAVDEGANDGAGDGGSRHAPIHRKGNVPGALAAALDAAGEDDAVLVTGSLYTVAEARTRWTRLHVPKRVDDLPTAEAVLRDANVTDPGVWRMRGKAVHRTIRTRVRVRQAEYLKQEMLSLGGECATSGLSRQDEEPADVVLSGTLAQFNRLLEKLDGQPYGLSQLGDQLRRRLGIRTDPDTAARERGYPWADGTAVMGILNVTPDSFHDGGEYDAVEDAVARAEAMVEAGADIVDVGGESTRPGADPVPAAAERDRVVPVIERIADLDAMVSIDTRKASVAAAALDAGADLLNDVSGLADPAMRLLAAERDVPVVVMHSVNAPVDPDVEVAYDDVVEDTLAGLVERVLLAETAGLDRSQILVDPGLGFGKSRHENFELLGRIGEFRALGCPVLVGHSHKSMFGLVGADEDERLAPTVAATALAAARGADVVRVHDVAENVAAVRTIEAADQPDDG
ncbi:dihydropteroate synthase [Haloglomus litoreum]|uniref:dihydropteroate synthase n=1 Tax=Haloglomus litoreum TaxID=3034026 RepID=UPI0023E8E94E|nr:dihydropteroate synthase [Haloglomus sp. DT116]